MRKILKAVFVSIFCLIFMSGCTSLLPVFTTVNETNNNKSVCQYVTKQTTSNTNESNTTLLSSSISSFLDAKNSSVRVMACYSVNDNEYEMSSSGFIVDGEYNSSTHKYVYYIVTSASGIFYRYVTNPSDSIDIENDVNIVRSGTFEMYMEDGNAYTGEMVGYFDAYDVAIFKFQSDKEYDVLELSNDEVSIGDTVYAYGTPVDGYNLLNTLIKGTVSGTNRLSDLYFSETINSKTYSAVISSYPTFQFDGSINLGMEGGPIINANGQVVGMIGYRYGTNAGTYMYESLSFGLSSANLKPIIESIISTGSFTKPLLGITITDIYNVSEKENYEWIEDNQIYSGVVILKDGISDNSPAYNASISDNSVLIKLVSDGKEYNISNLSCLYSALVQINPSNPLSVTYIDSNNQTHTKVVNLQ